MVISYSLVFPISYASSEAKSMGVRYTHFYDEFVGLVDSLMHDPDEAQRLANLQRLIKDSQRLLLRSRDEAAYALRVKYSSAEAASACGIGRASVDRWAVAHKDRNALPGLKRKPRLDLSGALDLGGGAASPQTSPPSS